MIISLSIFLSLSLYSFSQFLKGDYYKKNFYIIFFISVFIKIMLICLEYYGFYVNNFTIRDESTFIYSNLPLNISAGDNFLVYLIHKLRSFYDDKFFIKFFPIFVSFLYFYYLIKISKYLKFSDNLILLILIISLINPAYIIFNYSLTKEFLQGLFLLPSIYYSLKIIDKFNFFNFLRFTTVLIIFSYTHRGFEIISLSIFSFSIILFFLNNYLEIIKKYFMIYYPLILIFLIGIFLFLSYFLLGSLLVDDNFAGYLNNIRSSHMDSKNTYQILVESNNIFSILISLFKMTLFYFFYIPNEWSTTNIYYFCDMILTTTVIVIYILSFFQNNNKVDLNLKLKYYLIFFIFILMSIGFSIFTFNIGNAIRHKSITNPLVYFLIPFLFNIRLNKSISEYFIYIFKK